MRLGLIKTQFRGWFESFRRNWEPYLEKQMIIEPHDPKLKERIEDAHREWVEAQNYFDLVSEPKLVDYATYLIRAAETKYMYLLNKAKKE